MSFHREKYRPKGGPDGGNGGRGGSVVLVAEAGQASLKHLKDHPHQRAAAGTSGARNNRTGADAEDLVVPVPPGTRITDSSGTVLADLAAPGDRFVAASGGRGGRGNASFRSGTHRAPGFSELSEPGVEQWITLELHSIADVAVIGFPNAGKSTLVSAISAARPKVAAYPFTTVEPSLGVVQAGDERFTICDIPGLVEGAHEGKGLGLKFLRHADRAPVFVHLVDAAAGRDPAKDFAVVNRELEKYSSSLGAKPQQVVLNKIDLVDPGDLAEITQRFSRAGIDVLAVSAKSATGLQGLTERIWQMVKDARLQAGREGYELFRTEDDRIQVIRDGTSWRVESQRIRRWVAMTDLSNPEAVAYLQRRLERAGVEQELSRAGAKHSDQVSIGGSVFEWWPTGSDPYADEDSGGVDGTPRGRRGRRQARG